VPYRLFINRYTRLTFRETWRNRVIRSPVSEDHLVLRQSPGGFSYMLKLKVCHVHRASASLAQTARCQVIDDDQTPHVAIHAWILERSMHAKKQKRAFQTQQWSDACIWQMISYGPWKSGDRLRIPTHRCRVMKKNDKVVRTIPFELCCATQLSLSRALK
jgi:hypothetical protein